MVALSRFDGVEKPRQADLVRNASRTLIEQAEGVVSEGAELSMDEAFAALRTYARDHNRTLTT
ncbi:ANTAR domain-containing protein, partial [Cryobacterium cheniae]